MRAKIGLLILLAVICCGISTIEANDEEPKRAAVSGAQSRLVANFKLPKIFNFDKYKQMFKKDYPSHSEESARSKNYFGRAFKVFISGVKYVWKQSTKYYAINERSDWTEAERRASLTYPIERKWLEQQQQLAEAHEEEVSEDPAADLDEVREALGEIVAQKELSPGYAKVAAELDKLAKLAKRRRKRDSEERRAVDLDELLMGNSTELDDELGLEKLTSSISSNNPDYQQLEVFSEGVDDDDDDDDDDEMPEAERSRILGQTGKKYLSKIMGALMYPVKNNPLSDYVRARNREEPDLSRPDEVYLDYRDTGCLYKPKNQGKCGSCYIFSSTALFEYHQCIQSGKLVLFSEQYIIDCGSRIKMKGCRGGFEDQVGSFIEQFGLEQQHDYPYRAREDQCPYSKETPSRFMGHTKARQAKIKSLGFDIYSRRKLAEALQNYGPLLFSMTVNDDFHDYGGGVDLHENCSWLSAHSMLIVGHGIQDGLEYWLIRNSYGRRWGQSGYYKLSKGVPRRCLMSAAYVKPHFQQVDADEAHRKVLQNKRKIKMFLDRFGV